MGYVIWAAMWTVIGYYIGLEMQPAAEISGAIIGYVLATAIYILFKTGGGSSSSSFDGFDFGDFGGDD